MKDDTSTTTKEKLMYARVMVEVPLNKTYPDRIMFENELGQIVEQGVEYEWKPTLCEHCKIFGHTKENCRGLMKRANDAEAQEKGKGVVDTSTPAENKLISSKPQSPKKTGMPQKHISIGNSFDVLGDEKVIGEEKQRTEEAIAETRRGVKGPATHQGHDKRSPSIKIVGPSTGRGVGIPSPNE